MKMNNILEQPDHILMNIFTYLNYQQISTAQAVSKAWYRCSKSVRVQKLNSAKGYILTQEKRANELHIEDQRRWYEYNKEVKTITDLNLQKMNPYMYFLNLFCHNIFLSKDDALKTTEKLQINLAEIFFQEKNPEIGKRLAYSYLSGMTINCRRRL